jgi:enamine deaminase RidA (YjgF/YER057c/UK114 family)
MGNQVFLSGTLDTGSDGQPVGEDAYQQALNIFRKFEAILSDMGSGLDGIVRTRMYLVDVADAAAVSRAHHECFDAIRPAATMLVVSGFVGAGFKVEIEADAIVSSAVD